LNLTLDVTSTDLDKARGNFFDNQKLFLESLITCYLLQQEYLSRDIGDWIFRDDLSLVYYPNQSNLREVTLDFKASKYDKMFENVS